METINSLTGQVCIIKTYFTEKSIARLAALVKEHHHAAEIMRAALASLIYGCGSRGFNCSEIRILDKGNFQLLIDLFTFANERPNTPWPRAIVELAEYSRNRIAEEEKFAVL